MLQLPNWLIVCGTNRNAGKTTMISRIITQFHAEITVCAIKISPHFHPLEEEALILAKTDDFVIVKEVKHSTGKDSSRMLDAGAGLVLYIQVWDNNLEQVVPLIMNLIPAGSAVICESGWVRNMIDPGLFLILHRKDEPEIKENVAKLKPLADRWIESDGINFSLEINQISFINGCWKISG